ncbi:MAG TPA: hypothetical protein VMH87_08165 [Pseudomonadales bacterium]|nr:hypothetical protein [Pseudomonadales bacterium]
MKKSVLTPWPIISPPAALKFESDFYYDADLFHGWVEPDERRAVKYSITRADYFRQSPGT